MIAVMNSNNFELDRTSDVVEDDRRTKPRVSEEDVVSDKYGVSRCDVVVIHGGGGHEGTSTSLRSSVPEEFMISAELEKRAAEGEQARVFDVNVSDADKIRSDEIGVLQAESSPREIDTENHVRNVKSEHSGSRTGKAHAEVGKSTASQHDSMLDEFAKDRRGEALAVGPSKPLGYGFEIGDMVWGKVKSHPWWPGHIYSEGFASPSVRRSKRDGHVLVAFFGDSSYGWFDPAELIPFVPNFAEKSRQTNSRTFVKAVEEAVDEASRRCGLGLACRCRNEHNFRPTNVRGCYAVDVTDYEHGGVYSANQIRKARDSFKPRDTIAFMKHLALAPTSSEHGGIHFIKNKAAVLAYRRAVFEEFDETYAQAFGYQPVRPSRGQPQDVAQPSRAPLSGPLVIAEALGKAKNSAKTIKAKSQAKKDKYLFKRRDEPDELKTHQINQGQATSSAQPVYVEGSLAIATGDYMLQNRGPAVSVKPQISAKHEQTLAIENPAVLKSSSSPPGQAPGYSSHLLEGRPLIEKGKGVVQIKKSLGSNVAVGPISRDGSEPGVAASDFKDSTDFKSVEGFEKPPSQPGTIELLERKPVQVTEMVTENGGKKSKVRKRSVAELNSEKSLPLEKEKKKKRKKELTSSDSTQIHASASKSGASAGKVIGKPVQVSLDVEHQRKDDPASTSLLPNSAGAQQMTGGLGQYDMELGLLLSDLKAFALNPFHRLERSPAVIRQVFLRFRSLVYQKSLASMPAAAENESNETRATTSPPVTGENVREIPSLKLQKPAIRHDDPTKGGRKRGPSDRQEEMAAKKKKKVNDLRLLSAEKKSAQKVPEAPRGAGKETLAPTPKPVKKTDPPSKADRPIPTMLVMKFPPQGTLPSLNELKARFARFGPLDHSGSRVFWNTLTCRVVFRHKLDAQAAYKFVVGSNNLFGNTNVRCHLREIGVAGPDSESGKFQREDTSSMGTTTPQLRDSSVEQRAAVPPPESQPGGQLKSILKKSGDEVGLVSSSSGSGSGSGGSGNGNGKGTPRVKFMLGGEESNRGEQLMVIGNKNNNASFADGNTSSSSSSSSHGMDFNSKNFQKVNLPPPLPPILPLPNAQFSNKVQYYTEVVAPPLPPPPPRNGQNFNKPINPPTTAPPNVDIARQMISLLTRCNDVVTNVTGLLGYVPYHPL